MRKIMWVGLLVPALSPGAASADVLSLIDGPPGLSAEIRKEPEHDPELRAPAKNLALQYKARLDWQAYLGTIADSTQYLGTAVGMQMDVTAPLCRYIGGAFDAHAFNDKSGAGLAYDGRVTACLPWGPFALELGFIEQHQQRVGLRAAPTSPAGRFDARGAELRIRGFRWLEPTWEIVTMPAEVRFIDSAPAGSGRENASFSLDFALVRYVRYSAGPAEEDRVIEVFPVRWTGEQDQFGAMQSAVVTDVGLVRVEGARLSPTLFFDGHLGFQQGETGDIGRGEAVPPDHRELAAGVDAALHHVRGSVRTRLQYRRGLLPDAEFRLLEEDRIELETRSRGTSDAAALGAFAASTRTRASPIGTDPIASARTYGVHTDYSRPLFGPLNLYLRGEVARSYYANAGRERLAVPELEARATAAITAAWSSAQF